MIVEVADFLVEESRRTEFASAIALGVKTVLSKADGYRAHTVLACHENKSRFLLIVHWETLEDHTVGFRQSAAFADWRAIIGPFFQKPPHVEHFVVSDQSD